MCQIFGTFRLFHLHRRVRTWNRQSVKKSWDIKFRRQGIIPKKAHNFICITAHSFRLPLSSCGCVNKGMFYNKTPIVLNAIFLILTVGNTKWCRLTEVRKCFYWFKTLKPKKVKINVAAVLKLSFTNSHKQLPQIQLKYLH